jgi:hypothetical protein
MKMLLKNLMLRFLWPPFLWPPFLWPPFLWPPFLWPPFLWPPFLWPPFLWPLFLWAGFASAAYAKCPENSASGDRALVIAIGEYQFATEARRLAGPKQDAVEMRQFLEKDLRYRAEQICVLQDRQATAAAIREAVQQWLIPGSKNGHRVFLYYSGHGNQTGANNFDEDFDQYLVPYDFRSDAPEHQEFLIRDNEVHTWLQDLRGRQVTLLVDSCFSGTIYRSLMPRFVSALTRSLSSRAPWSANSEYPPPSRSVRSVTQNAFIRNDGQAGLVVWMASASNQLAYDQEINTVMHGHFTYHWLQAARRYGAESLLAIHRRLSADAEKYCRTVIQEKCLGLNPMLLAPIADRTRSMAQVLGAQVLGAGAAEERSLVPISIAAKVESALRPQAAIPKPQKNPNCSGTFKARLQDLYLGESTCFSKGSDFELAVEPFHKASHLTVLRLLENRLEQLDSSTLAACTSMKLRLGIDADAKPGAGVLLVLSSDRALQPLNRNIVVEAAVASAKPASSLGATNKQEASSLDVAPEHKETQLISTDPVPPLNSLVNELLNPYLDQLQLAPNDYRVAILNFRGEEKASDCK